MIPIPGNTLKSKVRILVVVVLMSILKELPILQIIIRQQYFQDPVREVVIELKEAILLYLYTGLYTP